MSDQGLDAVAIFSNGVWRYLGSVTSGLDSPDGDWVDKQGNLYVANCCNGKNITEYGPSGSLIFTYSDGLSNPINVTTDERGNVYVANYDYLNPYYYGYITEYSQGSNVAKETCFLGVGVEGAAVDKGGDVFVAYNVNAAYGPGYIVEFRHGLTGCHGTTLGVTLGFAGGMVLDKSGNLIVADQDASSVDIVSPPYHSVSGTLGADLNEPFHVTINKRNTQAYVVLGTDTSSPAVDVLSYPSGSTIKTLNSSNGLSLPLGAVDSQNFIP